MINTLYFVILTLLYLCFAFGCSSNYKEANNKAVETLRHQLVNDRFGEIYDQSSEITKSQLTRKQFVEKIGIAVGKMKEIDPNLSWRRDERGSPEEAVYRDDNWSSLILEKNGRRIDIQLDWAQPFTLCGMSISGDIAEGGIRVFRNCD
ncbi:MAG: hypothetical protein H7070_14510 [Saprospiraceae bacterium]|nr:hypothetical protein [Pyrinomonadaceae bacterium]